LFLNLVKPFQITLTYYRCRSKSPIARFKETHVEDRVDEYLGLTSNVERENITYILIEVVG
jgi:hypothetical protein